MSEQTVNKKVGGLERARKAREELVLVFQDEQNPLYFAKDIELSREFGISRHTIYKIREELEIPPRTSRILLALKSLSLENHTIKELSSMLGLKYQNLYRIIKDNNLQVKPDTPPIESLKNHRKLKKAF